MQTILFSNGLDASICIYLIFIFCVMHASLLSLKHIFLKCIDADSLPL